MIFLLTLKNFKTNFLILIIQIISLIVFEHLQLVIAKENEYRQEIIK